MITINISSNTIFFTKSEQQALHAALYTRFIPFRPFFIPFYTCLYLIEKHITSLHSTFQSFCKSNYTLSLLFFKNYTLLSLHHQAPLLAAHNKKQLMKHIYSILLTFLSLTASAQKNAAPHIIVLGIAQDGGYPHMGCQRQCCQRTFKDKSLSRYVVSLALVNPQTRQWWLFEATPDIAEQLQYFKQLTGGTYNFVPDGIFITHAHIGHYTGLMKLGKEVMSTHDIPVYTLPKLKKFLETNGPWSQLVNYHNIAPVEMAEYRHGGSIYAATDLGSGIKVLAYRVPHRDEYSETAGFRIETPDKKYIFIPDINKWDLWETNIIEVTKSVDVALVDATFFDENDLPARNLKNVPHPLVTETMNLFKNESPETKAKVRLIHFNHTNPLLWDKKKQKEVKAAGFTYATQGEEI